MRALLTSQTLPHDCTLTAIYNAYRLLTGTNPKLAYNDALQSLGLHRGACLVDYGELVGTLGLTLTPISLSRIKTASVTIAEVKIKSRSYTHSVTLFPLSRKLMGVANSQTFGDPYATVTWEDLHQEFQFVRGRAWSVRLASNP